MWAGKAAKCRGKGVYALYLLCLLNIFDVDFDFFGYDNFGF